MDEIEKLFYLALFVFEVVMILPTLIIEGVDMTKLSILSMPSFIFLICGIYASTFLRKTEEERI